MRLINLIPITLIVLFLGACSAWPISVGLAPTSLDLGAVGNTAGKVVYPAARTDFDKPVLDVRTITIKGDASISPAPTSDIGFTFYGRAEDPATDINCNLSGNYYLCDATAETAISGEIAFTPTDTTQNIELSGDVLVSGINQGSIWLGAAVSGGGAVAVTLSFDNLVAIVTLF